MTDGPKTGQSEIVEGLAQVAEPGTDAPGFDALFEQNYAFVWRTLYHFGVPEPVVDDAAQDVFIVVHRRLTDFDGRTSLRSWLWGIARRVARGYQRGAMRAERKLRVVPRPEAEPAPDEKLEHQEAIRIVDEVLSRLPDEQREVFILADIEGQTAPEIARTLGVKLNTVYSRLRSARGQLMRVIARHRARERGGA